MPDKIRVFLVEDDEGAAETCQATIKSKFPQVEVEVEGDFQKALDRVKSVGTDILVLDLYEDPVNQPEGQPIWKQIWTTNFCPIIFHTAHERPEDPALPEDHPFVRFIQKGPGSDDQVARDVEHFLPHVSAIRSVIEEIGTVVQNVLKDVSPQIWKSQSTPQYDETLMRSARRRVAAMMDLKTLLTDKQMQNWEQYIVPPMTSHPLLGDLILIDQMEPTQPASYRLVLTPSCDMVSGRQKVKQVLVARCIEISHYVRSTGLLDSKDDTKQQRLPSFLTQDQCGGCIPLPEYPDVVPLMAADLRDLELLPIEEIAGPQSSTAKYRIVASIDSPFRERIAWAYLQLAGRPGVPDCDMQVFIDAIIRATKS